jgi:CubicO group peptidase (beta-lactamase class C family)
MGGRLIPWEKIDALIEPLCKPDEPGCALGVFKHGRAIYMKGYGSKRAGQRDPIGSRTVFNLGSVSKQFTAFGILLLQEQGRLSLEDDFRKHLPEFGLAYRGIKIRHLLHHSSGLISLEDLYWGAADAHEWKPGTLAHLRQLAARKERNFKAGDEFCYCNDGYLLLAHIIRRRSNMEFDDFLKVRIFRPLGMGSTRVVDRDGLCIPELAQGHRFVKKAWQPAPKLFYTPGPGDIHSTVEDLGRWERSLCERSLAGPSVYRAQERRAKVGRSLPTDAGYAAGLILTTFMKRYRCVWHNGADTGIHSALYRLPGQGLCVALLWNRGWDGPSTKMDGALMRRLLDLPEPKPGPKGRVLPKAMAKAAGIYEGVDHPGVVELQPEKKGFKLGCGWPMDMAWLGQGRLSGSIGNGQWPYTLKPGPGAAWTLTQRHQGKPARRYRRTGEAQDQVPGMAALVGRYQDPGKHWKFSILRKRNQIFFRDAHNYGQPDGRLRFMAPDRLFFEWAGGYLQIEKNARGRVLALWSTWPEGRIKRIRCAKVAA